MSSFRLIQIGNRVYDNTQSVTGIVTDINYKTNVAEVEVEATSETEVILCKLFNLTVVGKLNNNTKKIRVKYFNLNSTKLSKISQGDWIDLRASETVEMKAGEFKMIPLGVAMKLPDGYEAPVIPRSSTFKNYGILQANSYGLIDNSYSGNDDQWHFPAYATRDVTINFDERICQFRIQERMEDIEFEEVEELDGKNRGGLGSTGVK